METKNAERKMLCSLSRTCDFKGCAHKEPHGKMLSCDWHASECCDGVCEEIHEDPEKLLNELNATKQEVARLRKIEKAARKLNRAVKAGCLGFLFGREQKPGDEEKINEAVDAMNDALRAVK